MPDIRIITWNSGGEAAGRGAALTAFATAINAAHFNPAVAGSVPVQIVTTQEANVGGEVQSLQRLRSPLSTISSPDISVNMSLRERDNPCASGSQRHTDLLG